MPSLRAWLSLGVYDVPVCWREAGEFISWRYFYHFKIDYGLLAKELRRRGVGLNLVFARKNLFRFIRKLMH